MNEKFETLSLGGYTSETQVSLSHRSELVFGSLGQGCGFHAVSFKETINPSYPSCPLSARLELFVHWFRLHV